MAASSLLSAEIASQPGELAALLEREIPRARRLVERLPPFDLAVIAARGTSDHAADYARYVWPHLAGVPVAAAIPSLHTLYRTPPRLGEAVVVGISQSGQSPDVVAVVDEARRQGRPTIAITNDPGSPLGAAADHVLQICLTPERSVAATKTYTCELGAVALLGALWSGDAARIEALRAVPEAMARVHDGCAAAAPAVATALAGDAELLCVARGMNQCTALELALKLRELVGLGTIGFSAADFRHGSIALAERGLPVALVMPQGATLEDMRALAVDLEGRGARVITIGDGPRAGGLHLPLAASVPEWLSPITAIVPGQRLAVALAEARGLDPDRPRGLASKIVRTL